MHYGSGTHNATRAEPEDHDHHDGAQHPSSSEHWHDRNENHSHLLSKTDVTLAVKQIR